MDMTGWGTDLVSYFGATYTSGYGKAAAVTSLAAFPLCSFLKKNMYTGKCMLTPTQQAQHNLNHVNLVHQSSVSKFNLHYIPKCPHPPKCIVYTKHLLSSHSGKKTSTAERDRKRERENQRERDIDTLWTHIFLVLPIHYKWPVLIMLYLWKLDVSFQHILCKHIDWTHWWSVLPYRILIIRHWWTLNQDMSCNYSLIMNVRMWRN